MTIDPKLLKFTSSSPVIASFPSESIASGLSTVPFFGIASETSAAVDYHLITDSSVFSQPVGTRRSGVGTTEIDFDTANLNLARTAEGTAYFSAGIGVISGDVGHLTAQLFKYDGSDETAISSEITSASLTGADTEMVFLALPITKTLIPAGELLRLKVKIVAENAGDIVDLGHDPANQDFNSLLPGTVDSTIMKLIMQFRAVD